jgi:hypothetical protein
MKSGALNAGLMKTDNSNLEFRTDDISTIRYNILLPTSKYPYKGHENILTKTMKIK